jgi:hypothetical protein
MSADSVLADYLAEEYDTEDEEHAAQVAMLAIAALAGAGYRIVKQEQIGWRRKTTGWLVAGTEPRTHPSFEPVWRDLP